MTYKMKLNLNDGSTIISPKIAPNNPNHNYDNPEIAREIEKTGHSMMKYKLIKKYMILKGNDDAS